ncbi:MAG: zinc ribbon domain-containing protein [Myxococcales bacterium]|nr:zinc ribbon domain-containing protein [Myxococcales bacterium]
MPIYDYQCQKCGHEFEKEQRIVEDPIKRCPACKSNQAKRLISKTSFVLKGGGWYNDLYASTGGKPGGDAKGDAGGKDASSGSDSSAKSDEGSTPKKDAGKGNDSKKKGKSSKSAA